jgi:ABC-type multidrug transport system fused ATPase/permease subunit
MCFYQLISILLVATIVVPWILVLLPFLSYLLIRLYNRSIQAFREASRIESMTKSPLLSFIGETFNGKSTIRAFKRQKDFIRENNAQLNYNIKANRWSNSVQAWFSLRIDLISITILSFSTIFCVLTKDAGNKVFFALLLTYILLLNDFILWTVKCFTAVEKMMVNVDRCLKILDVP